MKSKNGRARVLETRETSSFVAVVYSKKIYFYSVGISGSKLSCIKRDEVWSVWNTTENSYLLGNGMNGIWKTILFHTPTESALLAALQSAGDI